MYEKCIPIITAAMGYVPKTLNWYLQDLELSKKNQNTEREYYNVCLYLVQLKSLKSF